MLDFGYRYERRRKMRARLVGRALAILAALGFAALIFDWPGVLHGEYRAPAAAKAR